VCVRRRREASHLPSWCSMSATPSLANMREKWRREHGARARAGRHRDRHERVGEPWRKVSTRARGSGRGDVAGLRAVVGHAETPGARLGPVLTIGNRSAISVLSRPGCAAGDLRTSTRRLAVLHFSVARRAITARRPGRASGMVHAADELRRRRWRLTRWNISFRSTDGDAQIVGSSRLIHGPWA